MTLAVVGSVFVVRSDPKSLINTVNVIFYSQAFLFAVATAGAIQLDAPALNMGFDVPNFSNLEG